MSEQILFCYDCILKHVTDLIHHIEQNPESKLAKYLPLLNEIKQFAEEQLNVKDPEMLKKVRDLEHHLEDLLVGVTRMRKGLYGDPVGEYGVVVGESERYIHETIRPKEECEPGSFRTIHRDEHAIIICCPRGQWDPEKQRCKVGTIAQAILHPKEEKLEECEVCTGGIE